MKRVLVTGASGFIGMALINRLMQDGEYKVRVFVRNATSFKYKIKTKRITLNKYLEIMEGSLRNAEDIKEMIREVDVIFHCAAKKSGYIAAMYHDTVIATRNLLQGIVDSKMKIQRFVLISSFSVYNTFGLKRDTIIDENNGIEKGNEYHRDAYKYVKVKQEKIVRKFMEKYGLPAVILRPGVVYGPGGDIISQRVGFNLLGRFIHIGGNNLLPLSFIDNCIDAILLSVHVDEAVGEVFNIHDSQLISCRKYLELYKNYNRNLKTIRVPYLVFKVFSYLYEKYVTISKEQLPPVISIFKTASTWKSMRFSNQKLVQKLGFKQRVTTMEGLRTHFKSLNG